MRKYNDFTKVLSSSLPLLIFTTYIYIHINYLGLVPVHKDVSEAATGDVLWEKVFLEISQNSQENTCTRASGRLLLKFGFSIFSSLNILSNLRSIYHLFNPLHASTTKLSNTLELFVFGHFVGLALKGLRKKSNDPWNLLMNLSVKYSLFADKRVISFRKKLGKNPSRQIHIQS